MNRELGVLTAFAVVLSSQVAWAEDEPPAVDDVEAAEVEEENASEAPPDAGTPPDGARFRFGVAGGYGLMAWDGPMFQYTGVDLRFGVQINDLVAVYAQPQLGGYWSNDVYAGGVATGGLVGASVLADFTFIDRVFVGGGFGYAILNNPSGFELHMRAGGYPLMGRRTDKPRRRGLMLGIDFRLHFVEGYTFAAPTFNIGYEAF